MPTYAICVDTRLYPIPAIEKTAASFNETFVVELQYDGGHQVDVRLKSRSEECATSPLDIFNTRLIDVALQDRIAQQTGEIRLALVRAALAEALSAGDMECQHTKS